MKLTFDRPLLGASETAGVIEKDGDRIGEMKRSFRPPHERPGKSPQYDVNIQITAGKDTYEITQQTFSISGGHHWMLTHNGRNIGEITSPKGLKAKHHIELHSSDLPPLFIQAAWKGNAILSVNGNDIGETKAAGFLFNAAYITEINAPETEIAPPLLAGLVFTFWSSHTRG
ncbi:hypothetical protein [Salisediminibacterium halotolerans]|uniref:Uncharacterized protein n=1 Tax=Salisediminibacterium halotolerans TaxID=517425 RepID=A0A1H9U7M1_9BACI|nr:hypothetical protein [Salisediminibacterium haloalkalitolerans]SES05147.1 hypothetical protein SAMN05444126_1133 [Salisediminibacterium haloalkalitolerans]